MHEKNMNQTRTGLTEAYAQSLSANCDPDLWPSDMHFARRTLSSHDDRGEWGAGGRRGKSEFWQKLQSWKIKQEGHDGPVSLTWVSLEPNYFKVCPPV